MITHAKDCLRCRVSTWVPESPQIQRKGECLLAGQGVKAFSICIVSLSPSTVFTQKLSGCLDRSKTKIRFCLQGCNIN